MTPAALAPALARALAAALVLSAAPALAGEAGDGTEAETARAEGSDEAPVDVALEAAPQGQPAAAPAPAPTPAGAPPFAMARPVFDEAWATIGLGAGLVPSYAGSDDYIAFPLPLIAGRVGGVGISPNGPGFVLDLNPGPPGLSPRKGPRVAFGPAFRLRNDRNVQIRDDVVERAGKLDAALEVGGNVALVWRGVFKPVDVFGIGVQARWDVLGAHQGMVIEPQINYRAAIGRAFALQMQASAEFVDDSFADYYFTVSPAQAAATGLPQFRADGGLNRLGTIAILSYDLDRNQLNGGWALTAIGGYSRMIGDAADSPFTALRGDPNQFITGLGVAYTF